jgi:hypothetical protein
MATPRGRLNRSGTPQRRFPPSANSDTGSNPFSSIPQQTFGAVGNGLVFGGSQDNNAAPQSGGFTFSATSTQGNNPFASNPFANVNGTPNFGSQTPQTNSMMRDDDSMDTGSPDKKRSRNEGSIFGASQSTSQSQSQTGKPFGSLFGASSAGSQPQTSAPTSNIFGAPQTQSQASTTPSLFGGLQSQSQSSSTSSPNLFGQPQTGSQTPVSKPLFSFGGSTTASASQSPAPSFSFLGASQSQNKTTNPSSNIFGAPQTQTQTPSASPDLFGASQSQAQDAPATNPFAGLTAKPTTSPSQSQSTSTPNPFAGISATSSTPASSQTPAPTSSAPAPNFGGLFGASTPASQSQAPSTSTPNMFAKSQTETQTTQAPNPFASLSASTPAPQTQFKFGQSTSQPSLEKQPATSFNFGQAAKATSTESVAENKSSPVPNLFGSKPNTSAGASISQAQPASFPNLFGSKPTNTEATPAEQPAASSNIFGQPPKPAPQASAEKQASAPFNLFGQPPKPAASTSPEKQSAPSSNIFGQPVKPSGQTSPEKPTATSSNLFGSATSGAPSTQLEKPDASTASEQQPPAASNLFSSAVSTKPTSHFGYAVTSPGAAPPPPSSAKDVPTERQVYTKSPSRVPKSLNAEGFMEYDKNYRLRALNKQFQAQINAIDPDRYDFENLVRHYAAARATIGGDMGLYQRTMAGSKRKTGEVEEENIPPQYKKMKMSQTAAAQASKATTGFVPAPVPTSNPFSTISASPAKTTNLVGVNAVNAGNTPAPKKTNTFGTFQPSTTPVKSPPKKSLFGMSSAEPSITKKRKNSSDDEAEEVDTEDSTRNKRSKFSKAMPSIENNDSSKRKANSDDEDEEVSSEDEGRKKRTKSAIGTPRNPFAAINPNSLNKTPSSVKKNGPFISDDEEEETDNQTADDAEDGDFAPNAEESDDDSDDEESQQASDEDNVQTTQEDSETSNAPEEDHTEEIKNNPMTGRSLFDRVESPAIKPQSTSAASTNQTSTSSIDWKAAGKSSTESNPFGSLTPGSQSPYKPATTFTFTPTPSNKPSPFAGSSVLSGGSTNGQESKFNGMFGSRSGTPDPDQPSNKAAGPTSTPSDNTWKKGSDIKFNLTEATPEKAASASFGTNSLGFSFGSSTPAPGFLSAAPHLGIESGISSGVSSRATSPGATDNESVATNDTNDDEAAQTDAQQDLMASNPGEENDELLGTFKAKALVIAKGERAKQLKIAENEWKSIGVGELRLLKSAESGRVRVLIRSNPGANIVLNNYLEPEVDYVVREQAESQKSGAVIGAFVRDGHLDTIVLKVKEAETAKELAALMMKHRNDRK